MVEVDLNKNVYSDSAPFWLQSFLERVMVNLVSVASFMTTAVLRSDDSLAVTTSVLDTNHYNLTLAALAGVAAGATAPKH